MGNVPVAIHNSTFDASETNELPQDVLESRMLLSHLIKSIANE